MIKNIMGNYCCPQERKINPYALELNISESSCKNKDDGVTQDVMADLENPMINDHEVESTIKLEDLNLEELFPDEEVDRMIKEFFDEMENQKPEENFTKLGKASKQDLIKTTIYLQFD